jgi:outer membrane protein assembly factor BamD (BamD/ComL family)
MPSASQQLEWASELRRTGKVRAARKAFDALVRQWPDSREAALAQLDCAQLIEGGGSLLEAFDQYQYLVVYYPHGFPYESVIERQYAIAQAIMTNRYGAFLFFRGFASPERARPLLEQVLRNAPTWTNAPQAQFDLASIDERNRDYEAAITAYEAVVLRYPGSPIAPEAAFRQAECSVALSRRSPQSREIREEACAALARSIHAYPEHSGASKAREDLADLERKQALFLYEQGQYYDNIVKNPAAALVVYREFLRKFASSDLAAAVSNRVVEIEARGGDRKQ